MENSYLCTLFCFGMRKTIILRKAWMLLSTLLLTTFAMAQDPCEITCSAEMPVCSESAVTLSVPNNYQYSFSWSPGGQTTSSITVHPFVTTTYSVEVRDVESGDVICQNEITVEVKSRFEVNFRQVKLTCSNREEENGRNAQVLAMVDSLSNVYEPPFVYEWQVSPLHIAPNDPTWAIGLEAYKYYYIKVTDGRGCTQKDSVTLKAYPNPVAEISADPGDTVYLQNPHVTYSFENLTADSLDISNFYWILNQQYNLTSTELEPRFTYVETGDYSAELKVYNPQGCDTTYFHSIRVEPVKLKIPNVFTPNLQGENNRFRIFCNQDILSAKVEIFNRWGEKICHFDGLKESWDGKYNGIPCQQGTYVYKIAYTTTDTPYSENILFGSITLVR